MKWNQLLLLTRFFLVDMYKEVKQVATEATLYYTRVVRESTTVFEEVSIFIVALVPELQYFYWRILNVNTPMTVKTGLTDRYLWDAFN